MESTKGMSSGTKFLIWIAILGAIGAIVYFLVLPIVFDSIDAAVYNDSKDTYYFFKGAECWKSVGRGTMSGPVSTKTEFGAPDSFPDSLDAVVYNKDTDTYYFFKDTDVWTLAQGTFQDTPQPVSTSQFTGVPTPIRAGMYSPDGKFYYLYSNKALYVSLNGTSLRYENTPDSPFKELYDVLPPNPDAFIWVPSNEGFFIFKSKRYRKFPDKKWLNTKDNWSGWSIW